MVSEVKEEKYRELLKSTRFYKKTLPDKDEYVRVLIQDFKDVGIYCYINEYKKYAFMSYKDASSSKKLKNIRKEVTKNHTYILITTAVDHEKGFIDVEKRSIDKTEESTYNALISLYQRVFTIFIKVFIFNNPNCSQEELYAFLDNTLWREDPKRIQDNMLHIHSDLQLVIDKYNITGILAKEIINGLLEIIPRPKYKYTIKLQVNSLSIQASDDIKEAMIQLNKLLDVEFKVDSAPNYICNIIKDYDKDDPPENKLIQYTENVKKYIETVSKDELFMKFISSHYILQ